MSLLLTLALALSSPTAAHAASPDIPQLLSQNGIRPLEPPTPAKDFTLPSVDGKKRSLKDAAGKFVVLTFFATWCGPCAMEMPSLEKLAQASTGKNVQILGVSIDDDPSPLKDYVKQRGLTFPVLSDANGKVAGAYHASSVPTSFIIDPSGRLLGMSRGARDWSRLGPMFDALLGLAPVAPGGPIYADNDKVELPPILKPPTATVQVSDAAPYVGDPFAIEVKIRWAGNFDEYILMPPVVHLPADVKELNTRATTSTLEGDQVVTYTVDLVANAAGKLALDPVELRYTPRFDKQPVTSRVPGPTIEAQPHILAGMAPMALAAGGIGLLIAALGSTVVWRRQRRTPAVKPVAAGSRYDELSASLGRCREKRLNGDTAGFLGELLAIELKLDDSDESTRAALEVQVQRARYGGGGPGREELAEMEHRVERRLAALKPNPKKEEREAIRFAKI